VIMHRYAKLEHFSKDAEHMKRKGFKLVSGPTPEQRRRLINLLLFFWPRKTTYFAVFEPSESAGLSS
jgi:hypothetical protein